MEEQVFNRCVKLMGSPFELTVVTGEETWANECMDMAIEEMQRIERLLTTFSDTSETALINAHAGIAPVKVSLETFALIERSIRISALTQGAFDITYGSIDKRLWNFDTGMSRLPDPHLAKKMIRLIDYRKIVLDRNSHSVFLQEEGMRIGFGGIGKGYAAEMARTLLRRLGVTSGVINAAGDLTAWGYRPDGSAWTIGVVDPDRPGEIIALLNITDMAVATSGNYEKYVIIDGRRYSHTIDPRTGLPVTGIKSVTILCPNAEIADALATPVMIMGAAAGLDMINQLRHVEAILIDDRNKVYTSENITTHLKKKGK